MPTQRRRVQIVLVLVAMLAGTACGARLSPAQQRLALSSGSGGGSSSGLGPASGGSSTSGPTGPVGGASGPTGSHTSGGSGGSHGGGGGGSTTQSIPGAPTSSACGSGKNTASDVGVTANQITVANIADVTGPVPGLFQSAQQATQAFFAYWNSTHGGVCGRAVKVINLDAQTSDNGDRSAMLQACSQAFATVGSISAFDDGGAPVEQQCGIPDISAAAVTPAHQKVPNAYPADSTQANEISSTIAQYWAQKDPGGVSHAAFLYIDAGASAINAGYDVKNYQRYGHGWHFVYVQPIAVSDFNYSPYVEKMRQDGVKYVQFLGAWQEAAQLAQAMQQQGYTPDEYVLDPTGYNPGYVQQAGAAANGTYIYDDASFFEESAGNPSLQLYLSWLQRVAPGATPSYFGELAWSASLLFVTEAQKVGADLTRKGLLAALAGVHSWDGGGITSPQDVGGRTTSECFAFTQLHGNTWHRAYPASGFACNPIITSPE